MEAISAYFLREKGCVERAHCIKLELMRERRRRRRRRRRGENNRIEEEEGKQKIRAG